MQSIKATLILSLTTLILLAGYIAYSSHQDRFALLPIQSDKSIYVFDRKNNTLNYCTSDSQCKLIKLNLPTEHISTGTMLPTSLLNILEGKNSKGKEGVNVAKKTTTQKATVAITATQPTSVPTLQAKKPALVPAEIHTPAMPTLQMPIMPAATPPVAIAPIAPEATATITTTSAEPAALPSVSQTSVP